LDSFFLSDSEEEYEADEEDAQEVGYASEPAVGLSDVSILMPYSWLQKLLPSSLTLTFNIDF
jgi:hypothetical protein